MSSFDQIIAAVLFGGAVLHTFATPYFTKAATRFRGDSVLAGVFRLLGEVEVVFGLWAAILVLTLMSQSGKTAALDFLHSMSFTEPIFVFVITCIAATKPVLAGAEALIMTVARPIPLPNGLAFYAATLIVGPLLGSLITEPAAMAVTALLLRDRYFGTNAPDRFRYGTLGLLFVNVSVGGVLTHFAAPPVLMVAGPWSWDTPFVFATFGWRALLIVLTNTLLATAVFRRHLRRHSVVKGRATDSRWWMILSHLAFLALVVLNAHHVVLFFPIFLFFLGWFAVTSSHQDALRLRDGLLVGFFLGGLVVLGKPQEWWLRPLCSQLGPAALFWGTTALTAITDNAALTYLGTLISPFPEPMRYALVAGAITGGGLTVIANAPNPVGFGILRPAFGARGINPLGLLVAAVPFTLIAACFLFLIP